MDSSELNSYLSNRTSYDLTTPQIQDKINYYVINHLYKPKVKIIYNRTSYYKDNIRMTLDENLISYVETEAQSKSTNFSNLFIDRTKNKSGS